MNGPTYIPAEPGESLTSIADMVARTTGDKAIRSMFRRAIRSDLLLYSTLPCRSADLCKATRLTYGDALQVLSKHSLLSFATCGMSAELAERATHCIAYQTASRTMFPRMLPGLESGNRYGVQCPECAFQATLTAGRRVSYCAHCIPYVTRCPWHGCRLVCDLECSRLEMLLSSEGDKARAENSLQYAQFARSISDDAPQEPLWPRTLGLLHAKGYVTEHGRLRIAEFHDSYRKLFSAGFEDERLTHFVHNTSSFDCCIRAVRRADRTAPAWFLVLLNYAARGVDDACTLHRPPHSPSEFVDVDAALRASKRARWLEQGSSHLEMTRTQVRHSLPDVWSWLYRNDRPWLLEHQRPTGKPVGGRRLHEIPGFISAAINRGDVDLREHHDGREPLPSAYQTRLAYGVNEYLFNRLPTMPPAVGRLAQLPGLKELFVSRRVGFAVAQLARDGKPMDIAAVSRAARLRIATVSKFGFKVSLAPHEIKASTSARPGPFYLKGGDAHAVPSAAPNSRETQLVSESHMDAPEPDASGDRAP